MKDIIATDIIKYNIVLNYIHGNAALTDYPFVIRLNILSISQINHFRSPAPKLVYCNKDIVYVLQFIIGWTDKIINT